MWQVGVWGGGVWNCVHECLVCFITLLIEAGNQNKYG